MSIVSCVHLLLLILFMNYLHICEGRSLIAAVSKGEKEKMLPLQNKHDNNFSLARLSVTTESNFNMEAPIEEHMVKQTRVDKNEQNPKQSKYKELKGKRTKLPNSKQGDHGSLVSISWRVPHDKRGEKQPGFNLDYSPPREHPGHHN